MSNTIAIDTQAVRDGISHKNKKRDFINERLPKVLTFLKKHGHDDKLTSLKSYDDILNLFRSEYPFPNAGDNENLKLLGISVHGLEDASKCLSSLNDDFVVKDGIASISDEWFKFNEDQRTAKAETESEIRVLEYSRKLADLINEGANKGYINKKSLWTNTKAFGLFTITEDGITEYSVQGIKHQAKMEV